MAAAVAAGDKSNPPKSTKEGSCIVQEPSYLFAILQCFYFVP